MTTSFSVARLVLAALLAVLPLRDGIVLAQENPDVTFELRPHCERETEDPADPCPEFAVRDPFSRQTDVLKVGDTLDMDLILHNPSGRPLRRFRAWIGYDSTVLQGTAFALSDAFPVATPGEDGFSVADNYVKASGTSEQDVTATKVVLARITMTVVAAPSVGTVLSFYDPVGTAQAHTGAFTGEGDTETNVAAAVQGSLAVRLETASSASSAATVSSASSDSSVVSSASSVVAAVSSVPASSAAPIASSASSVPAATGLFTQLQVQALRVTTEGSSAFLAWNPLPSAELAGYNLYYGTISGRYLQRRSVDRNAQTLTIRALPVGETYYFAVRAVSVGGLESDFSQEVAVTIGNPATSTSPLSGSLIEGPNGNAPKTDGEISGDSGPADWMLLFAGASAIMGTLLALRRQWTASALAR